VRREKTRVFRGCNPHPATGSLRQEAIGAAVEETNGHDSRCLSPYRMKMEALGGLAPVTPGDFQRKPPEPSMERGRE
jgi:hypothetical protein